MKIIIIGAGPGGYETALLAARRNLEVVLIESGPVGGTCLNEGCIPTKAFCKNAEVLDGLREAEEFGVTGLSYGFDFKKVVERKNAVVYQLRGGVEGLLGHKNITLVRGKASFKDQHTVVVDDKEYSADYVIIATGSVSASLPIDGADLPGVITSKEILDVDEVPQRLCVIGGGVIGLEFASIFRSFGSEVTVLEYCKDILPRFDTDLAKRLKQSLSKRGIEINTQAQVTGISENSGEYTVSFIRKGKEESVVSDKVLMAVGRRANIGSLNLSDAGVEFTPRGVLVNNVMQTNVPHIYAIGDINGQMMLAHAATFQGIVALDHIMGIENEIDLSVMPAAVFTSPEAASVGLTEDECKEKDIPVKCFKSFFRANGKAVTMGETDGFCKVVVAAEPKEGAESPYEPGRVLGCHMYGPHSSDIIQEACALISRKVTVSEFHDIIHTHPTLTEVLQSAIHGV
jgi:dihydrolipoamide dehydrogenase